MSVTPEVANGPPVASEPTTPGGPGPRRRRPRLPVVLVIVAFALVAGFVAYAVRSASVARPPVTAGLPTIPAGTLAAPFSLPRLGGGPPVVLASFRGRPTVVNFFASWCVDCRAELSAFGSVSRSDGRLVNFVGVDTNDPNAALARALLARAGARYPVGVDPSGSVANSRYLVSALPVTLFLGSSGRVVGEVVGAQSRSDLEGWISRLTSRT
ncbi:MAG: TlpA disulfide reductase family protein [Actinomycetota bacterium]|nr:TlpA disulfide reductase family protein [Actinomycetota bacterium]